MKNSTPIEIQKMRMGLGLCPTCGNQTHQRSEDGTLKSVNNEDCRQGRCLLCNPLSLKERTPNTLSLKIAGLGTSFIIEILPSSTVGELKDIIESHTSLPGPYQRLIAKGKDLKGDDTITLSHARIENRSKIMLFHNRTYAADKDAIQAIAKLDKEIDDLNSKRKSSDVMESKTINEIVTRICCKLDEIDSRGSVTIRSLRKRAIQKAESVGNDANRQG